MPNFFKVSGSNILWGVGVVSHLVQGCQGWGSLGLPWQSAACCGGWAIGTTESCWGLHDVLRQGKYHRTTILQGLIGCNAMLLNLWGWSQHKLQGRSGRKGNPPGCRRMLGLHWGDSWFVRSRTWCHWHAPQCCLPGMWCIVCMPIWRCFPGLCQFFTAAWNLVGGCHFIDWHWVPLVLPRCMDDLVVFLARLFEDVLWRDEALSDEMPNPMRNMDYVVAFFLVHGDMTLLTSLQRKDATT